MKKLFGTDGIRGMANCYPLTVDMAVTIGRAAAMFFQQLNSNRPVTMVVGKDTRISGDMLEKAICAGICSMGGRVYAADVLPTPGVAYLTAAWKADGGIVVSASHNPYHDNGIKFFRRDGYKLSDSQEFQLEEMIRENAPPAESAPKDSVVEPGSMEWVPHAEQTYVDFLKNVIKLAGGLEEDTAGGLDLVLDCANGAVSRIAPLIFPGARLLFAFPDGFNINAQCGSEYPEILQKTVVETGAAAGFAFDGDGDRVIAVDEKGQVVTGDRILAISAGFLHQQKQLQNNCVVSTVMSNIGLTRALMSRGIAHMKTDVGDRRVIEAMRTAGACLGGEDSGHIIFHQYQTTGDGLLTALMLGYILRHSDRPFSELAARSMTVFPQVLINVPVRDKPDLKTRPDIMETITAVESALGENGRVLIRYSGTQPICRVMVEARTEEETRGYATKIADVVQAALGNP